jgi:hypothetical protein
LVDRSGSPLAVCLSAANAHDSMLLEQTIDAVPAVKGPRGRPGGRASGLSSSTATRGTTTHAAALRCADAASLPRIARRRVEPRDKLGRHRYVVERSLAWLVGYRRQQVRYERRADILLGLMSLACALMCLKQLNRPKA